MSIFNSLSNFKVNFIDFGQKIISNIPSWSSTVDVFKPFKFSNSSSNSIGIQAENITSIVKQATISAKIVDNLHNVTKQTRRKYLFSLMCLTVYFLFQGHVAGPRNRKNDIRADSLALQVDMNGLGSSLIGRRLLALPSSTLGNLTLTEELDFYEEFITSDIFGTTSGGALTVSVDAENSSPLPAGSSLSNLQTRIISSIAISQISSIAYVNYYVLAGNAKNPNIQIISLKDISNPTIVGIIPTSTMVYDIACLVNACYVISGGLQVIDVTNLPNAVTVSYDKSIQPYQIAVSGNIGAVIQYLSQGGAVLNILDLTDPFTPLSKGVLQLNNFNAGSLDISNSIVCLSDYINGVLYSFSVSNITNPQMIGSTSTFPSGGANNPYTVKKYQDTCLVINGNSVQFFAVNKSSRPISINNITSSQPFGSMSIYENYLYLGSFEQMVEMDMSDTKNLVTVSTSYLPINPSDDTGFPQMAVSGPYLIYADNVGGLLSISTRGQTFVLQGIPAGGTKGTYQIKLAATNSNGTDINRDIFSDIVVNPAIIVQGGVEVPMGIIGRSLSFSVPLTAFKSVIDTNAKLTYSATLKDGSKLPSWLSFNSFDASFLGTPPAGSAGNLNVVVTASDSEASNLINFQIPIVYGPTLNIPILNQVAQVGVPFNFPLPNNTFIDQDGLSFELLVTNNGAPLPAWLTYANGIFSGNPTSQDLGTINVNINAVAANEVSTSTSFQIQTVIPGAPINQIPIPNQIAPVNKYFEYIIPEAAFLAPYGGTITYTAVGLPSWMTFDGKKFFGNPGNIDVGFPTATVSQIFLTASGATASTSISFTVIVSGTSTWTYVLSGVGSLGGLLTALKVIALTRAFCWNKRHKDLYRIPSETAMIGGSFEHKINNKKIVILKENVGKVTAFYKREKTRLGGLLPKCFYKTRDWAQGGLIRPAWLEYDNEENLIYVDEIPDPYTEDALEHGIIQESQAKGCIARISGCWKNMKDFICCVRPLDLEIGTVDYSTLKIRVYDKSGFIAQEFKLLIRRNDKLVGSPSQAKSLKRRAKRLESDLESQRNKNERKSFEEDPEAIGMEESSKVMDNLRNSVRGSQIGIHVDSPQVNYDPPPLMIDVNVSSSSGGLDHQGKDS